jgi:hypothetical protein
LEDTTRPAAPPDAVKGLDAVAADAGADPAAKKQAEQVKAKEKKIDRYAEAVLCLEMLNKVNWLSDMPNIDEYGEDLTTIFHEGMAYVEHYQHGTLLPWNLDNWPLNPRVWLGEMERALACLAQRGILPKWLTSPHDRHITHVTQLMGSRIQATRCWTFWSMPYGSGSTSLPARWNWSSGKASMNMAPVATGVPLVL